jgi:hypothetical protein
MPRKYNVDVTNKTCQLRDFLLVSPGLFLYPVHVRKNMMLSTMGVTWINEAAMLEVFRKIKVILHQERLKAKDYFTE